MAQEKGLQREQITFKCTKETISKIDTYVGQGELTNRNEVIRAALTFYFENKDKPSPKEQFKVWLLSEEGEMFVKEIIRKSSE